MALEDPRYVMGWKMKSSRIRRSLLLVLLIGVFSCSENDSGKIERKESRVNVLPYYDEASFTPHWYSSESDSLKDFHTIRNFELMDQNGDSFSNANLEGKIYVADFFFTTCPGICPKMTSNMGVLQAEFLTDDEVFLISHSVTPGKDSVAILQKYAVAKGVNDLNWRLLTGDRDVIYDLGRNYYFVEEDLGVTKSNEDFLHTENFVLIDKLGHIRGIYNGLNKTAIQQLIADIRTLKTEIE